MKVAGFCAVRCRDCGYRFTKGLLWLDGLTHARCPRCYRTDLTDWDEPYYYPPSYVQALLKIGAKAHRCRYCRVNFVSFFNRKRPELPAPGSGNHDSAAA